MFTTSCLEAIRWNLMMEMCLVEGSEVVRVVVIYTNSKYVEAKIGVDVMNAQ